MKEPNTSFQDISLRRRVTITVAILTVLIVVIGLFSFIAIMETNKRLHQSVLEGQMMIKATDTARMAQVHYKKQVQEWKNTLLRGYERDLFDKHFNAFNHEDKLVKEYLHALSDMTTAMRLFIPEIDIAIKAHEDMVERYRDALKHYKPSDLNSAILVDKKIRGIDRALTNQIDTIVGMIKSEADKRLKDTENVAKTRMEAYQIFSIFLIFLVLLGVCFGIYNVRTITRDLPPGKKAHKSETEK
jgi:methyl-accepting chemotaxis protein